jgi:uncharacterized protein (DUF736 family)
MAKKYALPIGSFIKNEHGVFNGTLETMAVKANVRLIPNDDKEKDNHPDYIVTTDANGYEIGVAWERSDDRGHYISVAFEEPSLAPGFYTLVKSGVEKGHQLLYRKPQFKKEAK